MRTDSVRLAPEAIQMARAYIGKNFKGPYLPEKPTVYKSKANIQDAHEAVRPTDVSLTPDDLKGHLKPEQLAVYTLIWRRFLASQMTPAVYDQTTVDIMAEGLLLRASGSILKFSGFLEVYQDTTTEDAMNGDGERTSMGRDRLLPPIEENDSVTLLSTEAAESGVLPEQHFTQPPPRYSEASLVKELEEDGVGRPSTYASIIDTLEKRRYVVLERRKRQFTPTPLGREVNNLLVEGFPDEINVKFTAKVESDLDEIESGDKEWLPILRDFYVEFDKKVQVAKRTLPNLKTKTEPIGRDCPDCGEPLVKKFSRNGWFISCSKYPDCKHSESIPTGDEDESETDEAMAEIEEKAPPCEDCGEPMQVKRGPYGLYLCCSAQPKEHKTRKIQAGGQPVEASVSTGVACARPKCGGEMVSRRARRTGRIFYGCNQFPKCNYAVWDLPVERECPTCEHPHITLKTTKKSGTQMVCPVKSCDYKEEAPPNLVSLAKSALQGAAQKQEQPT
jgi:DNA topoisomerase-1